MAVVRSVMISTCTACGSVLSSCGSRCSMLFTTAMVLAPGCAGCSDHRGVVLLHAASLAFSTPSTTRATSVSITGAPLR